MNGGIARLPSDGVRGGRGPIHRDTSDKDAPQ